MSFFGQQFFIERKFFFHRNFVFLTKYCQWSRLTGSIPSCRGSCEAKVTSFTPFFYMKNETASRRWPFQVNVMLSLSSVLMFQSILFLLLLFFDCREGLNEMYNVIRKQLDSEIELRKVQFSYVVWMVFNNFLSLKNNRAAVPSIPEIFSPGQNSLRKCDSPL